MIYLKVYISMCISFVSLVFPCVFKTVSTLVHLSPFCVVVSSQRLQCNQQATLFLCLSMDIFQVLIWSCKSWRTHSCLNLLTMKHQFCWTGSASGTRQNRRFIFNGKVNLHAGTNRIALLSVAVGLPVSWIPPSLFTNTSIFASSAKNKDQLKY